MNGAAPLEGVRRAPGPSLAAVPPAGWQAELELRFSRREARTVLAHNRHYGPLQVQKALYPEGAATCHVAVLHPPGGIAAGDRLHIGAGLDCGARALLTTPGATKWYRSEGEWARQAVHFHVAAAAVLEWLPRENIFFDGSRIDMRLDVDLGVDAVYVGWEILCFGRRAGGESWRHGALRMRTSIRRDGRPLWSELAEVDASGGFLDSPVGLAGCTVCATLLVAGCELADRWLAACRGVEAPGGSLVGVTRVPRVLVARYLGNSGEDAFRWCTRVWSLLRGPLSGRAACAPRVWAC